MKVLGIYTYHPLVGKKSQELPDAEGSSGKAEEGPKEADGSAVDEQEATSDTKSMSMEEAILQGIGSETQEMLKVVKSASTTLDINLMCLS